MDTSQLRRISSISSSAASAHVTMDYLTNLTGDQLRSQEFTLISFEYAVASKGKYIPCEVAVLKFSMTKGIIDAFHVFIDPKPLPTGCTADAKNHSAETHMIPALGFDQFDDDYSGILATIDEFCGDTPGFIFGVGSIATVNAVPGSKESSYAETNGCLTQLLERGQNRVQFNAKIFSAERLAMLLVEKIGVCSAAEAPRLVARYLERTKHDFAPGIRCGYHEVVDSLRCTRAAVFRFYFNLIELLFEPRKTQMDIRLMRIPDRCKISDPTGATDSNLQKSLKAERNSSQVGASKQISVGFGKMGTFDGRAGPSRNKGAIPNLKPVSSPLVKQATIVAQGVSQIAHHFSWYPRNVDVPNTQQKKEPEPKSEPKVTPRPEVDIGQSSRVESMAIGMKSSAGRTDGKDETYGSFTDTSTSDRAMYGSDENLLDMSNEARYYRTDVEENLEEQSEQSSYGRPPTVIERTDYKPMKTPRAEDVPPPPDDWLPASKYFSPDLDQSDYEQADQTTISGGSQRD